MIYDSLENINTYRGMGKNIDCAIDFLLGFPKDIETGKLIVDEERVFANVMTYNTKDIKEGFFEAHKEYLDIHVVLDGEEKLLNTPIEKLTEKETYNKENDCALYEGEAEQVVMLRSGDFVLCGPEDGHMPGVAVNEKRAVKKIVVKVKVSQEGQR